MHLLLQHYTGITQVILSSAPNKLYAVHHPVFEWDCIEHRSHEYEYPMACSWKIFKKQRDKYDPTLQPLFKQIQEDPAF